MLEELLLSFFARGIPWTRLPAKLYSPESQLFFVPVDHAERSPRAAMSEPGVFVVFFRSGESEGIAILHPLENVLN